MDPSFGFVYRFLWQDAGGQTPQMPDLGGLVGAEGIWRHWHDGGGGAVDDDDMKWHDDVHDDDVDDGDSVVDNEI